MPTEYQYYGIRLKDNGSLRRAGDSTVVYGPELRLLVGKNQKLSGIMLTEAQVLDTIDDCLKVLRWYSKQREGA